MFVPKIIILNGLPNCGKDTLGNYMKTQGAFLRKEFKEPLIKATKGLFDLTESEYQYVSARERKETPMPLLGGMSWREALIYTSEEVCKPKFGKDIFGRRVLSRLQMDLARIFGGVDFVFSDGGFPEEIQPLIEAFGAENILVIRIRGYGDTKVKDSRKFLSEEDLEGVTFVDYDNTGTLTEFLEGCAKIIKDFVAQRSKVVHN